MNYMNEVVCTFRGLGSECRAYSADLNARVPSTVYWAHMASCRETRHEFPDFGYTLLPAAAVWTSGVTAAARRRRKSPRSNMAVSAATTRGSNLVFTSELMMRTTYSGSIAAWYGRLVVMASKQSATMMMRGVSGISSPLRPWG